VRSGSPTGSTHSLRRSTKCAPPAVRGGPLGRTPELTPPVGARTRSRLEERQLQAEFRRIDEPPESLDLSGVPEKPAAG